MSSQQPHRDVAAYALGVLEPGDALRYEEHLGGCARCAAQLADFAGAARAVAALAGPGRSAAPPSAGLLERLTREVSEQRRRDGRRRLALAAVAAVLVAGTPFAVVAAREAPPAAVQRVVAKDPVSGVRASVALEDRGWGTEVAMRLTALPGPRVCRLVAIGKDGAEHPVLSWWVPDGGYGVADGPGRAGPLDVTGGTDLHPAEIGRWEVRGENGERLLSIGG